MHCRGWNSSNSTTRLEQIARQVEINGSRVRNHDPASTPIYFSLCLSVWNLSQPSPLQSLQSKSESACSMGIWNTLPALFVLILTPEYYLPLRQLSIRYHAAMSGIQAAGRIFSVLDLPESSQVPHQRKNEYPSLSSTNSIFPIEFYQVGACYPGQSSRSTITT